MSDQDEYNGDVCVVLPKDYLNSAEAVAEIYGDELAQADTNYGVDFVRRGHGLRFFTGSMLVALIWALSAVWSVCL